MQHGTSVAGNSMRYGDEDMYDIRPTDYYASVVQDIYISSIRISSGNFHDGSIAITLSSPSFTSTTENSRPTPSSRWSVLRMLALKPWKYIFLHKLVDWTLSFYKQGVLTERPWQCLDQSLFEQHQGVSAGKYTIGLGLTAMNYCTDREGIFSLELCYICFQRLRTDHDTKKMYALLLSRLCHHFSRSIASTPTPLEDWKLGLNPWLTRQSLSKLCSHSSLNLTETLVWRVLTQ